MAKQSDRSRSAARWPAEEVASVVHFLSADASSYITEQVWNVNGGMDI
jgi:NAD(P)-dependent dehydrogenase (short-subunit alcohol dehydrogenase family)